MTRFSKQIEKTVNLIQSFFLTDHTMNLEQLWYVVNR